MFLVIAFIANAQKLPNVQQISLRAPANIKIDGKLTEWGDQFQAYNHATDIFYRMANDDENLYLTVQAVDPDIINKIVDGGVTLTIQKSTDKKDKNNISITYPVADRKNHLMFNLRNRKGFVPDTSARAADSTMLYNNKKLEINCKWIRIKGIPDLDTLLSVYNIDGIKAAGLFDRRKIYTFEISVGLKYLRFSANDAIKFAYHIRVNGGRPITPPTPDNGASATAPGVVRILAVSARLDGIRTTPTDFWGEYTLAKK
ncbi:MAG: hypothetical protein JWP71_246 [Mucilaginibacter sp.]|nr:hypothetical protein [Mucilaginibacter sp.]